MVRPFSLNAKIASLLPTLSLCMRPATVCSPGAAPADLVRVLLPVVDSREPGCCFSAALAAVARNHDSSIKDSEQCKPRAALVSFTQPT